MDIENLSKTDLILTALFLSFVTAIVTGIVLVFLMEDAPKDIIRNQIISSETTATSTHSTGSVDPASTSDSELTVESGVPSRDEILDTAVRAVARITAESVSPQAGVLVDLSGYELVVTAASNYATSAQALFEDGTVADLENTANESEFSTFFVMTAGNRIYPLEAANSLPGPGSAAFVVPLSAQPEIVRVSITDVTDGYINTTASSLPATSLLLGNYGRLIGLYQVDRSAFRFIGHIERDI